MAVFNKTLSSGYVLRLTVTVKSQSKSSNQTIYNTSLQLIRSGLTRWAEGPHSWSIRTPANNVVYSGSISSYDFRNYSTLNLMSTKTVTTTGDTARHWEAHFSDSQWGNVGSGVAGGTVTPPKFPADPVVPKPNAPSALSVSRTSDTQHVLSWTRNSTYTSVLIQRSTGSGYSTIATASGNAATYTDKTTKGQQRYWYRVIGRNAGGSSGNSNAIGPIYTTPGKPGKPVPTRSGSNIRVAAGSLPTYATHFDIQDDGTSVVTALARGSLPWTHSAPSNLVTHRYRMRGRIASGTSNSTTLYGAWSDYSATVQLPAPPAAASNLSPGGVMIADGALVELRWRHNPVDSSGQTAAQYRYRVDGGDWITVTVTSTASVATQVFDLGVIEWQVRTQGGHASYGDWSATESFQVIAPPSVVILHPGEHVDRPALTVLWETLQGDELAQSAWSVELWTGPDLVESSSGTGATSELALETRLVDGASYTLSVQVETAGVQSEWTTQDFDVSFVPPEEPFAIVGWDEWSGLASVDVEPGEGEAPATVSMMIERSLDGETWELVAERLSPIAQVADGECSTWGETQYRVTAFADTGASTEAVVSLVVESGVVWLSGGIGFMDAARLPFNPEVDVTAARERGSWRFAGRTAPVAWAAPYEMRSITHAGVLIDGDEEVVSRDALEAIAVSAQPVHLYRDPTGRRMYGTLSPVNWVRQSHQLWAYSFTVDETERD